MANKDAPFGFRAVGKLGGAALNGGNTEYEIASGATGNIFSGDPVKMLNTMVQIGLLTICQFIYIIFGRIMLSSCLLNTVWRLLKYCQ